MTQLTDEELRRVANSGSPLEKEVRRRGRKPAGASAPSVRDANSRSDQRIAKRIMAATKTITRLTKTESREAGYAFVSIDDYYEQVARKVAEDHGIGWQLSELPAQEQRFQDVYSDYHIRKVFKITIISDDGDSLHAGEISVTLPYENASTTGKALSYADKAFMRQLFKIPTGEPEAELQPPVKRNEAGQQRDAKNKDTFFEKAPVDEAKK